MFSSLALGATVLQKQKMWLYGSHTPLLSFIAFLPSNFSFKKFHFLKQSINIQNIKTITYLQKIWNLSLSELASKVLKGICQISFEVMYYWPLENLLYSLFRILYMHVRAFGFHQQGLVSSAFSGFLFILLCHNVYGVITNFCIIKDVKRVILNAVAIHTKKEIFLQKGNVVENRVYYSSFISKCILATSDPRMIVEGRKCQKTRFLLIPACILFAMETLHLVCLRLVNLSSESLKRHNMPCYCWPRDSSEEYLDV